MANKTIGESRLFKNNSNQKKEPLIFANYRIKSKTVRCIDPEGGNLGIISKDDAINKAHEHGLDLVMVSDGKDGIPICKMLDYGKYKYEQSKKFKEINKKQRDSIVKIKEMKFHPTTDINDLRTKANKVSEFISEGDKVKISVIYKGREISHKEVGYETLNKFLSMVQNIEILEPETLQGKVLSVLVARKKEAKAS